MELTFQPVSA